MPPENEFATLIQKVCELHDADLLMCNCEMDRGIERRVVKECRKRIRRPNVIVILVTSGGNPDVAFRIARYLQCTYKEFKCIIPGWCKSAGTLLALGAKELIFGVHGELGPLDVQMVKKDELLESESGLTVMASLTAIHEKMLLAFDHFFLETTFKAGGRLSVQTASEIAVELAKGIFTPIARQVDPLHIGEAWRSMAIATEYGQRLIDKSKNADLEALSKIISGYPSHSFVIDRVEAQTIFETVRETTNDEQALLDKLGTSAISPLSKPFIRFLNDPPEEKHDADSAAGKTNDIAPEASGGDAAPQQHTRDTEGTGESAGQADISSPTAQG